MVGLPLSCLLSQDKEEAASGVEDAGDSEMFGNMKRRMEDKEVPGTQLWLLISPARPCPVTPTHINLFRQESRSRQDKWPAKRL